MVYDVHVQDVKGEKWIEMKAPNKNRSAWWFNAWRLYPLIGGPLTKSPAELSGNQEPIVLKVEFSFDGKMEARVSPSTV